MNLLRIATRQGGDPAIDLDRATQVSLTRDLTAPSECRVEFGDDDTWRDLQSAIAIGVEADVVVADRAFMRGRLLARQMSTSARAGNTIQLTLRTALADAMFAVCDSKIRVKGASLKDVIIRAYESIGVGESSFVFAADVEKDVAAETPDARELTQDEARVHFPETVYAFVERHLNRWSLTHWDLPDGRLIVAAPNDARPPVYAFTMSRQNPSSNNIIGATKLEDFEQVPVKLWVFGTAGGRDATASKVRGSDVDPLLLSVGPRLQRNAAVVDQSLKTTSQAESRARREMSNRSRRKDAWEFETPNWTQGGFAYQVNQTCDVKVDLAGIPQGKHLIWRVQLDMSADRGLTGRVSTVAQGIWKL